jgi:hypothetical protein
MPADLPDWVKALAPSEDGGVGADQRSALEDSVAQDSDAWPLAEKEPSIRSADASRPPADSDEPPDWLKDLAIGAETQAPESPPLQAGWSGGASMPGEEAHKDSTETGAGKDPLAWLEDLVEGPDGGRQDSGPTEAAPAGWEPATPPSADIEVGRQPAVNSTSFDRTGGDRQNSPDAQVSPQPARDWMSGLSGEGAFDGMDTEGEASAEPIMGEPDLAGWSGAENEGLQTHDADEPSARTPTAADSRKHTDGDMSAKQGSAVDLPEWLAGLDREESGSAPEDQAVASPRTIPEMLRTEESARPHGSMHDTSASGAAESLEATGEDLNARRQSLEPEPETARSSTPAPASAVDAQALPASAISSPGAASKKSFRAERKVSTPTLGGAKDELGRGNIAVALDIYSRLIRKGKSLEDIILELRDALHRYPVEVPIWQALGDAYMRANRLQEALDAYTKAEELLR